MKWLERHLEDPARLARLKRGFYIVLALVALGEILLPYLFPKDHAHFGFEDFPAWGSVYGLVSCIVIIKASKLLGKLGLMRPESYYDSEDTHEP